MAIDYTKVNQWILAEDALDPDHLGKCEAIMCLGNGYMGLRSATEERYLGETRNLLINGTFNKFDAGQVTELPNAADVTAVELWVNGIRFSLDQGSYSDYSRELNIKRGELTRRVVWTSPKGDQVRLEFRRIVSLKRLHIIGMQIKAAARSGPIKLKIRSSINGQVTNSGCQHFSETEKRFYEKKYLQYVETTTQSKIGFVVSAVNRFNLDGENQELPPSIHLGRRILYADYEVELNPGQVLTVEKFAHVSTTRDFDCGGRTLPELQAHSLEELKAAAPAGYGALAEESARQWAAEVWDNAPIDIQGDEASQLDLSAWYPRWKDGVEHIFLPVPTAEGVLPMDDRFMTLKEIDLSKYKQQEFVGGIMRDYNLKQIQGIQVCKQADCLVLFYLLEELFSPEVKKATFDYYERRTLHDSSLSLSTHSVQACDLGENQLAYDLFRRAAMIDLGPYPGSSDSGIHTASFGGVWQCAVYGFGGLRMLNGQLRLRLRLPENWDSLSYTVCWKGQKLGINITKSELSVQNLSNTGAIQANINGEVITLQEIPFSVELEQLQEHGLILY